MKKSDLTPEEKNIIRKKPGRPPTGLELQSKNIQYEKHHIEAMEKIRIARGLNTSAPVFRDAVAYALQWVGEW